jgi:hypothetical protein
MTMAIPAQQRWIFYAVALALTLVAVKWAGGQDRADDGVAAARQADEAARPARGASSPPAAATGGVPELRLDLLGSRASPAPAGDPFQARSWAPAPDPAEMNRPRLPLPPPQAPPLPFAYLGKLVEDATTTVFLARADRNYIVRAGDTIDGTYRVERIGEDALVVTYLPLKIQQTLPLGEPGAGYAPAAAATRPKPQQRMPDDEDDE